jgi:hypothetical protein
MAASDFFLLVMWRFGLSFLKKCHFAPPPTPIGGGLELGISFWHTSTPIVKFLFQEIFYPAKVTMIPRKMLKKWWSSLEQFSQIWLYTRVKHNSFYHSSTFCLTLKAKYRYLAIFTFFSLIASNMDRQFFLVVSFFWAIWSFIFLLILFLGIEATKDFLDKHKN